MVLTTEHSTACLERPLEVAFSRFVEDVEGDNLRVIESLKAHQRLDEQGLRVVHVQVKEEHHCDTKVHGARLETSL